MDRQVSDADPPFLNELVGKDVCVHEHYFIEVRNTCSRFNISNKIDFDLTTSLQAGDLGCNWSELFRCIIIKFQN